MRSWLSTVMDIRLGSMEIPAPAASYSALLAFSFGRSGAKEDVDPLVQEVAQASLWCQPLINGQLTALFFPTFQDGQVDHRATKLYMIVKLSRAKWVVLSKRIARRRAIKFRWEI